MSGTEPPSLRTAQEEACELGKDCSEEDEPGALSNGKENIKIILPFNCLMILITLIDMVQMHS